MKRNIIKKLATLLIAAVIASTIATPVLAAAPYKDMTVRYIGIDGYKAAKYLKKHKVYKGVVKGKYLHPFKKVKRGEFLKMLSNYVGKENVPITKTDKKKINKTATAVWAMKKIYAVSEKMGKGTDDWYPANFTLTRYFASRYIYGGLACYFKIKPRK